MVFCYPLRALRKEEVAPNIKARLQARGLDHQVFPRDVLDELYLHSQGNLRILNQLAGFCLMAAASEDNELVDRICLLQALAEMKPIWTGLDTYEKGRICTAVLTGDRPWTHAKTVRYLDLQQFQDAWKAGV